MTQQEKNPKPEPGACKYCFMPQLSPDTTRCPACRMRSPYVPMEEAVRTLLQRGHVLRAMSVVTTVRGCDMVKARRYCDGLNVQSHSVRGHPIEERVQKLVEIQEYGLAIQLTTEHSGWGPKQAREYVTLVSQGAFEHALEPEAAAISSGDAQE